MRKQFEMSNIQLEKLSDACKPVPMIALQCGTARRPQERANAAWGELGKVMGFDGMTVKPILSKSYNFFTAEVVCEQ